jgi:predicted MFS family arabinose efflux permease
LLIITIIAATGGGITLIANIYTLLVGRFIIGLAVGLYSSICPLFINELSPP